MITGAVLVETVEAHMVDVLNRGLDTDEVLLEFGLEPESMRELCRWNLLQLVDMIGSADIELIASFYTMGFCHAWACREALA